MAESEEELKCFWMKVEEKSEKCWLNAQHSENQDHSSGPISSHQFHLVPGPIDGETVETVTDSLAGGAPKSLQMVTTVLKLKDARSWEEKL